MAARENPTALRARVWCRYGGKGRWPVIGLRRAFSSLAGLSPAREENVGSANSAPRAKPRKAGQAPLLAGQARGEKHFTGRLVPPRHLRLSSIVSFLLGSVPDPAAVSHSGRDSQFREHPPIKNNPGDNEEDEEPQAFHDTSQPGIFWRPGQGRPRFPLTMARSYR
jgi:hypothetical protein